MFVGLAKLTLSIPGAASLKDKRQVVRKLLDRTRAKFNVAAAEVGDNDLWQKAVIGLAVVGNDRRFVGESLDTILHYVEELYLAPIVAREIEVLGTGEGLHGSLAVGHGGLRIDDGHRTLAEAEGLTGDDEDWKDEDWDGDEG